MINCCCRCCISLKSHTLNNALNADLSYLPWRLSPCHLLQGHGISSRAETGTQTSPEAGQGFFMKPRTVHNHAVHFPYICNADVLKTVKNRLTVDKTNTNGCKFPITFSIHVSIVSVYRQLLINALITCFKYIWPINIKLCVVISIVCIKTRCTIYKMYF